MDYRGYHSSDNGKDINVLTQQEYPKLSSNT